jgi:hypothetical protein
MGDIRKLAVCAQKNVCGGFAKMTGPKAPKSRFVRVFVAD